MIARVSGASLLLEEAVLHHLFHVVAKVEHLDVEGVLGQDPPQLPVVLSACGPRAPTTRPAQGA